MSGVRRCRVSSASLLTVPGLPEPAHGREERVWDQQKRDDGSSRPSGEIIRRIENREEHARQNGDDQECGTRVETGDRLRLLVELGHRAGSITVRRQ